MIWYISCVLLANFALGLKFNVHGQGIILKSLRIAIDTAQMNKTLLTRASVDELNVESLSYQDFHAHCMNRSLHSLYCGKFLKSEEYQYSMKYEDIASIMKIFIVILAYSSVLNPYLLQALTYHHQGLCHVDYVVRIVIQTVDVWELEAYETLIESFPCSITTFDIDIMTYDRSLGNMLSIQHRQLILEVIDDYDLFIYQEDDLAINVSHIQHFLSYSNLVPDITTDIIGFTRHEIVNISTFFTCDSCNFATSYPQGGKFFIESPFPKYRLACGIDDDPFIIDEVNPHQGFWMMKRDQIKLMNSEACDFFHQDDADLLFPRYIREYMSSLSIYSSDSLVQRVVGVQDHHTCHRRKVIPAAYWMIMSVHHMRQRYAQNRPILTIGDAFRSFLALAHDHYAIDRGEVPYCWQNRYFESS